MTTKEVQFKNKAWDSSGTLHFPETFSESKKYAAIVVAHPISSCKEQTAFIYASKMAKLGYVCLAFDGSTQGASGGIGRYEEDPATRVADFSYVVDYLVTLKFVDEEHIGVLGICGGGAYSVNAAMTERRFKAVASVVGGNYGRILREGDLSRNAAVKALEGISAQRIAEARGAEKGLTVYIPPTKDALESLQITDVDIVEAVDYYTTSRGQKSGSPNKLDIVSTGRAFAFDAFHLTEHLLTQPLQIIVGGGKAGAFGSYRDGFTLFDKAASQDKNILVVPDATHYDLYDRPEPVSKAIAQLESFFKKHL